MNRTLGHRELLHSLAMWGLSAALTLSLPFWWDWQSWLALRLGYGSHLAGDACPCTGIPLRYPRQEKFYLLPTKLRIATGSKIEELVFAISACLTLTLLLSAMALGL